jgi:hypothetical protein
LEAAFVAQPEEKTFDGTIKDVCMLLGGMRALHGTGFAGLISEGK